MRIEKFRVQGFKNLTEPLVMDNLRGYNVIHGVNNIGKSNLLEAMSLLMQPSKTLSNDAKPLTGDAKLEILAWVPGLFEPTTQSDEEEKLVDAKLVSVLSWHGSRFIGLMDIQDTFVFGPSNSATTNLFRPDPVDNLLRANRRGPMQDERFLLIPVSRSLSEKIPTQKSRETTLALEMYDAQQSEDIANVKRWRAFVEAMKDFQDITGPGEFVATFQRASSEAQLMFEMQDARIPFRLLGSGIQQIVTLLGMILMSNASIIAIEEPELNLRWALQTRLAQTLRNLLANPDAGIDQLFLTTHSPAFSDTPDFWLMRKGAAGPVIERRPSSDLALVLQDSLQAPPVLPHNEIKAWLTPQGVVQVPAFVLAQLQLEHGGAVIFRTMQDGVLLQNEDIALANAGLASEATSAA